MLLKKVKNYKGFTLVELMIVILILLIMVAIALPAIMALRSIDTDGTSSLNVITQQQEEKYDGDKKNNDIEVKQITPKTKGVNKKL